MIGRHGVVVALFFASLACAADRSGAQAKMGETKMVSATLQLAPQGDAWSVAFDLRNPGAKVVELQIMEPFLAFSVEVTTEDGRAVEVIQPAIDVPSRPRSIRLEAGQTARLSTPVRLGFDPNTGPAGTTDRWRFSLRSAPVPVRVRARLSIDGVTKDPVEAKLVP